MTVEVLEPKGDLKPQTNPFPDTTPENLRFRSVPVKEKRIGLIWRLVQ